MISVSGNIWEEIKINKRLLQKLNQDFDFNDLTSRLIINKNFNNEEIYSLNNSIDFSNPFLNDSDFINSINIILDFIKVKKKILIIGDYDVDGSVSTAMLVNFFENINHPCDFYIPDRIKDGYGVSKKLLRKLGNKIPELIIIVDSGSKSYESINYLNNLNIKSIIIDHHEISKPYPKSNVLINPKKKFKSNDKINLCASALVYFLIDLLKKKLKLKFSNKLNLFLTALATTCDVMPLRGLNRNIVLKAFKEYNYKNSYFINYLITQTKKINNFDYDDFAYLIGPILNSGGRLNNSNLPTLLITSTDINKIKKISDDLINLNKKRKEIEKQIINRINNNNFIKINESIIIIKDISIPEGLIGLIAARFQERLNKSIIVITQSGNLLKGSARSTSNINIGVLINNCVLKNILINGGGHQMAAGFTLKKENFDIFKNFLKDYKVKNYKDKKTYVSKISPSAININFLKDLRKFAPFGNSNKNPIFLVQNLSILKPKRIQNSHISCLLKDRRNKFFKAISFNSINTKIESFLLNYKKEVNVLCEFKLSNLKKNQIDIYIVDIIV